MAKRNKLGFFKTLADGRVKVQVSHGYTYDGKQRKTIGYARNMEEAERLAIKLAADLGRDPKLGKGLTLSRWWAAYRAGKGQRITKATLKRYEGDMNRVWLPALGDKDITEISRYQVQEILIGLGTRCAAKHAKSCLSAVLTQAVREGHLALNPIREGGFEMPEDVGAHDSDEIDYEADPFAAIEGSQDVWDARTVLEAFPRMRGSTLETVFLAMVGAGLRREEALALRWRDVRRVEINGRMLTQLAVHHALTAADGYKRTKTKGSVRIVAMVEPFGERLWDLRGEGTLPVCEISVQNINKRWKTLFDPVVSIHARQKDRNQGRLCGLPYLRLNRLRATHATYLQQAGVLDSVNASLHGHSERVSYTNYQRPDSTDAAQRASEFLVLQGSRKAANA